MREGLTIHPLKSGGSGVQTYSHYHPTEMPTALEAGTLNGHGIAGLNAAVAYIERVRDGSDPRNRAEVDVDVL